MAYKTVLAFLAIEDSIGSLDTAINLAQTLDAHLDIVILGVLMPPPVVMHNVAPAAEWARHNHKLLDEASARVKQVEEYVAEQKVSASVTAECDYLTNLERIAARYSYCADLHVANAGSFKDHNSLEKAFNGTLFNAGCPFLLIPDAARNLAKFSKLAIAWNGRAEASHAARSALPLLKRAERVNIIVIDPQEEDVGEDPGSDLAAHLSRYGINITVDVLASGGMTVAQKLTQRTRDIDADLLIMGGYGHTKLRQWLLGGATHDMLENAELPIFMTH